MIRCIPFLIIPFILFEACSSTKTNNGKSLGGILFFTNEPKEIKSLILIENNSEIRLSDDYYYPIKNLNPGYYTLSVEWGKRKLSRRVINQIFVSADSLSLVPFELFKLNYKDTLTWEDKTFWNKHSGKHPVVVEPVMKIQMVDQIPTCSIAGKIIDSWTREPIKGANVILIGNYSWGASTDKNGNYCAKNILPGIYTVRASGLSYRSEYINNVRLGKDSTSIVDFKLGPDFILGFPPFDWEENIVEGQCD